MYVCKTQPAHSACTTTTRQAGAKDNDVSKLKQDSKKQTFVNNLCSRLDAPEHSSKDVDESWTVFRDTVHSSAMDFLGPVFRKHQKKGRQKPRECHNHKPKPFPDPKRKRKQTILNKHKPKKRTKSTKISSVFPKRGNRNTKRTEKHKNKMTHGKTYNKSPRRINHKATRSKTNTGTTALERSVEQTTGGFKALLQLANFTLGPDASLNTEMHKISVRIKAPNSVNVV